jgi:deoxyribose-phosphate aldolase
MQEKTKMQKQSNPPDLWPLPHSKKELARYIDHTLLKPDSTLADIQNLAKEARQYGFATCCVNSGYIKPLSELLIDSNVLPIAVVGFPLGSCLTSVKVFETKAAIQNGAKEIDMVLDIGSLKAKNLNAVEQDIAAVVKAAHPMPVKVILETALLDDEEKILACNLALKAGADFVKTSTGFAKSGATINDIKLMKKTVGTKMKVKASGGIRTTQDALQMIQAGANRIGASSSVAIVNGFDEKNDPQKMLEQAQKTQADSDVY